MSQHLPLTNVRKWVTTSTDLDDPLCPQNRVRTQIGLLVQIVELYKPGTRNNNLCDCSFQNGRVERFQRMPVRWFRIVRRWRVLLPS